MTLRVTYSALARKDLQNIRQWTLANFGREKSDDYIKQIDASLHLIADRPGLARDASAVRPDLKKYISGQHFAYFKITDSSIAVVRILYGRMDVERWI
ncbi:MAG: type II toxin-antitoxin system RelE/ParE family toxin [Rhizobiaceae bacterium]